MEGKGALLILGSLGQRSRSPGQMYQNRLSNNFENEFQRHTCVQLILNWLILLFKISVTKQHLRGHNILQTCLVSIWNGQQKCCLYHNSMFLKGCKRVIPSLVDTNTFLYSWASNIDKCGVLVGPSLYNPLVWKVSYRDNILKALKVLLNCLS